MATAMPSLALQLLHCLICVRCLLYIQSKACVHLCCMDCLQYASLPAAEWCSAYAGYSTVQGPSSPLVRPHPAVWRLIHGIIVLYLVSLIFLLFQDAHDARLFLKVEAEQADSTLLSGIGCICIDCFFYNMFPRM